MRWDELSEEELTDWRKSPVTEAFAEILTQSRADALSELEAATLRDEASRHEISRIAGRLAGLDLARKLLEDA